MTRDPLSVLSAIRKRTLDLARQAHATCLTAQAEASDRLAAWDAADRQDREAAAASPERCLFLDMLAARQQRDRTQRANLATVLAATESRTNDARSQLSAARQAAEAVADLIETRTIAATAEAERQAQHAADDMARARLFNRP